MGIGGLGSWIFSSSQSCDRTRLDNENKDSLPWWLNFWLCRGGVSWPLNLRLLTFQDSFSPSSGPTQLTDSPSASEGSARKTQAWPPGTDSGAAVKRMGKLLWRSCYRDHDYRALVSHSGAAAVGKSHKTALGSASLKKRGCGLTHLLLKESTSLQPKSFLRGHWGIQVITKWCCFHCSWPLVCEFL